MGRQNEKITIKDISEKLNVSAVTVHRALVGKEGVSDKLRKQIIEIANEMGYEMNYAAASLKRKACSIAVILPQDKGLYFTYLWKGLHAGLKDAAALNVTVEEFVCTDEENQYELLKKIADENGEGYSGVITFSYTRLPKVLLQLQRLAAQDVATVVIDDELNSLDGVYCIPANEKVVGRVAAEFVSLITPERGHVVVSSGRLDSKIHENKLKSFCEYLTREKPGIQIHVVEGYSSNDPAMESKLCDRLCEEMKSHTDVVAGYALTAYDNTIITKAAEDAGVIDHVTLIGTDLNKITAHLLADRKLKCVIDQAAFMKGRQSLEILVNRIVKNQSPPLRLDCPIDVVLNSNLQFYEHLKNI